MKKLLLKYRLWRQNNIPAQRLKSVNADFSPLSEEKRHQIDLITVAFNDVRLIKMQAKLLHKFFSCPYTFTVADNSSSQTARNEICHFCEEQKIPYISLPENPYRKDGSSSHGWAINFMLHKYLYVRKADFFGFLDHDIFPCTFFDPRDFLKHQPCYGLHQSRDEKWYLWPGLCFFQTSKSPDNFMPITGLDTGGGGWEKYYSQIPTDNLQFNPHEGTHIIPTQSGESIEVDKFGCWLHFRDSSNWSGQQDHERILQRKLDYLNTLC